MDIPGFIQREETTLRRQADGGGNVCTKYSGPFQRCWRHRNDGGTRVYTRMPTFSLSPQEGLSTLCLFAVRTPVCRSMGKKAISQEPISATREMPVVLLPGSSLISTGVRFCALPVFENGGERQPMITIEGTTKNDGAKLRRRNGRPRARSERNEGEVQRTVK